MGDVSCGGSPVPSSLTNECCGWRLHRLPGFHSVNEVSLAPQSYAVARQCRRCDISTLPGSPQVACGPMASATNRLLAWGTCRPSSQVNAGSYCRSSMRAAQTAQTAQLSCHQAVRPVRLLRLVRPVSSVGQQPAAPFDEVGRSDSLHLRNFAFATVHVRDQWFQRLSHLSGGLCIADR